MAYCIRIQARKGTGYREIQIREYPDTETKRIHEYILWSERVSVVFDKPVAKC